jgi:hypothetical protein
MHLKAVGHVLPDNPHVTERVTEGSGVTELSVTQLNMRPLSVASHKVESSLTPYKNQTAD